MRLAHAASVRIAPAPVERLLTDRPPSPTPADCAAPPPGGDLDVGDHLGPYHLDDRLGRGGCATVFIGTDGRDGRRCAIKLLRPGQGDPDALATRFRREFRALSRLHHPNVVRVEEWGVDGGRPWFTMEYVEGTDLKQAAQQMAGRPPEVREAWVRDVVVQAARALAYIHDHGLVHRDVSPGNLLVRPDGVVKLTDFGIVRGREPDVTRATEILGTVAYASPEQLRNERLDGRADLYSLGVVLYELLTGRKPFRAHTVQGWMDRHLNDVPRPPSDHDPLVPADLERVCMRLLRKDPSERFASAWHLLRALGDRADEPLSDAWPPRLVGRTEITAWMREMLDAVAAGRPGGARAVVGPSGSGKTRLLQEMARAARQRGLPVAVARCRPHDRPYGAFSAILAGVPPHTIPARLSSLYADRDAVPDRWPVMEAFLALLRANTPSVVLVDGLEHADAATREVVGFLVRNSVALDSLPVVFVLAAEGSDTSVIPEGLGDGLALSYLNPMTRAEVEELVLAMMADETAATVVAARLYEETRGNPAHLADMLHAMSDEGLLVAEPSGGWRLTIPVDDVASSDLPLPASLRASLVERLAPVDADARDLARMLSLHPGPLDLDTLLDAVDLDEDRAMEALDRLVDAGIVTERRTDDQERVELSHARFRDVLLDGVAADVRATMHRTLGDALEHRHRHRPGPVLEALAWHYEQAGIAPRALTWLARSGHRHLARGLHDTAVRQLDRALVVAEQARPLLTMEDVDRQVLSIRLDRAEALHHLGRWTEAEADGHAALALAKTLRDDVSRSRAHAALGAILRWRTALDEAEPHLREALALARDTDDPKLLAQPTYHLGAIAWMRQDLDIAEARWHHARELAHRADDRRAAGLALVGLGILAFCRGDTERAREQLEEAVTVFEALGMQADLAIARVDLVELNMSTGLLSRALDDADRTTARARALNQRQGVAMGLVWRARVLRALGRLDDAQRCAQEALSMAERIGAVEEEAGALAILTAVLLAMDLPRFAAPRVQRLREVLDRVDHEGARAYAATLQARVHVALGEHDIARQVLTEAADLEAPFPHVRVRMAVAAGKAHLALGDRPRAREALEHALSVAQAHGYRYYALVAHHTLVGAMDDADERRQHADAAARLARALAQGLSRDDAASFRQRGWGVRGPSTR